MKKTLAIFSQTSCEGCQFEMLNHYEEFSKLLDFFEIKNFRLGSCADSAGPFDVAVVEGNPEGKEQEKFLKNLRKVSEIIIIIGSCAHLGGIQSQRNRLPEKYTGAGKTKTTAEIVKVDFHVPGCPINHAELYKCLMDIYWGKIFRLPDLAVCFECKQNENKCLLKDGKPCLGPITRMGCNSICVNKGEACLGCRGLIDSPNIHELREKLGQFMSEKEIDNLMTFYGDLTKGSNE